MKTLPRTTSRRKFRKSETDSFKVYAPNPEKEYKKNHMAKALIAGSYQDILKTMTRLRGKSRIMLALSFFSAHKFVRLASLENLIERPELLAEAAKFSPHDEVRTAAVSMLEGMPEELSKVACGSRFSKTRKKALEIIGKEKKLLFRVAAKAGYPDTRKEALELISSNKELLIKLTTEAESRSVRKKAVELLGYCEWALRRVLFSKTPPEVRRLALKTLSKFPDAITDEKVLLEIAINSPDEEGRFVAIGKLSTNPSALQEVVEKTRKKDSRSTALMLLSDTVDDIEDGGILQMIAILSPYPDCRSVALEKLRGRTEALEKVAIESKSRDSRLAALEMLAEESGSLLKLYREARRADVRNRAKEILSKPEVLGNHLATMIR